jgi:hypothetical protein
MQIGCHGFPPNHSLRNDGPASGQMASLSRCSAPQLAGHILDVGGDNVPIVLGGEIP